MDVEKFSARCKELGLGRVCSDLIALSRPAVHIQSVEWDDAAIYPGGSKLGGDPDVPESFKWPEWQDRKLAFLAQINLAELAEAADVPLLPKNGVLSFFYDPDQSTWGFDPKDKGSWRTYYFQDSENLQRRDTPDINSQLDPGFSKYHTCWMNFVPIISFPHSFSDALDTLNLSESERDAYFDLYYEMRPDQANHQMLGHAEIVQNPMEVECQFVTQGIYTGDGQWVHRRNFDKLKKGFESWRLLLQLDSDDNTGWMWGDLGMIYFWIKEDHLKEQAFSETWMIFQCS